MDNLFSLFEIGIGAYLLYCAATGSGQLFRNEHVKKGMEALYKKRMRMLALILGPLMLGAGAMEYVVIENPALMPLFYVVWGLSGVVVIIMCVVSVRMTDRRAKERAKTGGAVPRGAFDFDNESGERK